jgi:DNA repair photolyase
MARRFGRVRDYDEWCRPRLVSNTLELLDAEIPRLRNRIRNVQLCFATDPFMYGYDDVREMSLAAIRMLNDAGIPCVVLSKGLLPPALADQPRGNALGITLVSLDEEYRAEAEPGAAPYTERVAALRRLHEAGHATWVSMEPYPSPNVVEQDIMDVLESVSFVNRMVFGRTNYSRLASSYPNVKDWYAIQAHLVMDWCAHRGIECYVKKGTLPKDERARMRMPVPAGA